MPVVPSFFARSNYRSSTHKAELFRSDEANDAQMVMFSCCNACCRKISCAFYFVCCAPVTRSILSLFPCVVFVAF